MENKTTRTLLEVSDELSHLSSLVMCIECTLESDKGVPLGDAAMSCMVVYDRLIDLADELMVINRSVKGAG